ncbi:MAG: HAD-IA family hydrolase [Bacteroidaceae bacterium]|jgi:HAD superfamily hydrolase (TIGR01509 family)|nr:HAD-IA family hydrolase [Bacteroidaceae bacterium]
MFKREKTDYMKKHGFEEMNLKAVLFDMDGVLFDSMPNHALAWSEGMKKYGLPMTKEEAYMHEGRTGAGTINILAQRTWGRDATEEEKQQIYAWKTEVFNKCPQAGPMPGAAELLNKIKADGLQIVLVTGSGQKSLLDRLNTHFPGIFTSDKMVTAFDVKYGKPNPEPYLMGLQKAGIKPNEAIVVENAPLGVQAGVAANIFTIAVNTGPLPDSVLLCEGANLLLHSMQELSDKWPELLKSFKNNER